MVQDRKLFELISIIARRHGLSGLDPSSRLMLDCIIERETNHQLTTARDLIEQTQLTRALVYRKLNDLKHCGWIKENWVDFKLCYLAGPQSEMMFHALAEALPK